MAISFGLATQGAENLFSFDWTSVAASSAPKDLSVRALSSDHSEATVGPVKVDVAKESRWLTVEQIRAPIGWSFDRQLNGKTESVQNARFYRGAAQFDLLNTEGTLIKNVDLGSLAETDELLIAQHEIGELAVITSNELDDFPLNGTLLINQYGQDVYGTLKYQTTEESFSVADGDFVVIPPVHGYPQDDETWDEELKVLSFVPDFGRDVIVLWNDLFMRNGQKRIVFLLPPTRTGSYRAGGAMELLQIEPRIVATAHSPGTTTIAGAPRHFLNNDSSELFPLLVNDDEDDTVGSADNADTTLGADDDDLMKVNLKLSMRGLTSWDHLEITPSSENIRIYEMSGSSPILLPLNGGKFTTTLTDNNSIATALKSEVGLDIYAEAMASSREETIEITLAEADDEESLDVRELVTIGPLIKVDLAVDADRSGTEFDPGIQFGGSDKTTEEEPYRFWVNNDRDSGSDDEAQDNEPISGQEDYWSPAILNSRGMEDLSRIWIDVDGIAEQLKDGSLRLGLEWKNVTGDPKIKLYKAVEVDGGMKYLFDENVADLQREVANRSAIQFNTGNYGGPPNEFFVNKNEPVYFDTSFWDDLPGDGIEHFLFEGAGEGKGELVFVLQSATGGAYQDIEMSMSGVWFDLKDIKKLYQHFTVGDSISADPASSASEINSVSKADLDEMEMDEDYILFVHGWRMPPWERRYFAETAFKRLYWLGYKGRFGLFSWPTEWTSRPVGTAITDTENYMRSDHKAMQSGQGLAGTMNSLMGQYNDELRVFAHSMGNVVVSEALRQGGQVNTFVACQSASVARAYDATGPEHLTSQRINDALSGKSYGIGNLAAWLASIDNHPDVFANYPPTGEVYYKDILNNVIGGRIINHHNRQDDALAWWLAGQAKKPNSGYRYREPDANDPIGAWEKGYTGIHNAFIVEEELDFTTLEETHEIFARAAEPDSVPLGASVTTGHTTAGEITGNVNLNSATFTFEDGDEDHSAQFRSTIQRRWEYWDQLFFDFFPNL